MNKSLLIPGIVMVALLASVSPANASSGVTVSGRATAGTCDLQGDDATIALPRLDDRVVADIPEGIVPDSATQIELRLINCAGVTEVELTFSGVPLPGGQYKNTGSADGVALHLQDSLSGQPLPATGGSVTLPISGTGTTYIAQAHYYRLAGLDVLHGTVASQAMVSVAYR